MNDVRAATVQFNHETADKAYNLGRIRAFVDAAARQDVQLLVFPEMCITGYWALRTAAREELARLAEPVPSGPSTQELVRLAAQRDMTIGAGLIDPALWTNRHEHPAAIEAAFRGPKGRGWLMRWLPARAHDNGMFLLFSNGVVLDDDEVRTGNAMILDPYGRVIEETWTAGDDMVVADLDAGLLDLCTGQRWLRGRRPELYAPLTARTGRELDPRSARFSTT